MNAQQKKEIESMIQIQTEIQEVKIFIASIQNGLNKTNNRSKQKSRRFKPPLKVYITDRMKAQ